MRRDVWKEKKMVGEERSPEEEEEAFGGENVLRKRGDSWKEVLTESKS